MVNSFHNLFVLVSICSFPFIMPLIQIGLTHMPPGHIPAEWFSIRMSSPLNCILEIIDSVFIMMMFCLIPASFISSLSSSWWCPAAKTSVCPGNSCMPYVSYAFHPRCVSSGSIIDTFSIWAEWDRSPGGPVPRTSAVFRPAVAAVLHGDDGKHQRKKLPVFHIKWFYMVVQIITRAVFALFGFN